MAHVQLISRNVGGAPGTPFYRPEDRSGTVYYIPRPRLFVRLFVLPRDAVNRDWADNLPDDWTPEAILDTGSPLTIFPFLVWQPFRDAIQWLDQPPGAAGARRPPRTRPVRGG